ncbi:MAG: glycosyltransferase family 2 protein [Acidimicrobiales bacterium]
MTDPAESPTISVVTVAFGAEPWLEESVAASLATTGERVDVVLVDNGCTDGAVDRLAEVPGVTVVRLGGNTGFAGGCADGAAVATGEIVAFVNPDAIVEPECLHRLAEELRDSRTGISTASVRLADRPDRLNSAGNEIHYLGLSWSGAFDEPASRHAVRRDVLAASGACMAMTSEFYRQLGGFEREFFAYQEDADLSLRSWQAGRPVVFVPGAVVRHRYEFGRNTSKFYLLDRNRLICVLSLWGTRTLAVLAPLLLVQELAMWALAAAQGWLPERRRSVRWIAGHVSWLRRRRRDMQARRVVGDRSFADLFAVELDPGNLETPAVLRAVAPLFRGYWAIAKRLL